MSNTRTALPAAASAAPAETPDLVEVTLAKSHTHQRKDYVAGNKISVTALDRDFLIRHGVVADPKEA